MMEKRYALYSENNVLSGTPTETHLQCYVLDCQANSTDVLAVSAHSKMHTVKLYARTQLAYAGELVGHTNTVTDLQFSSVCQCRNAIKLLTMMITLNCCCLLACLLTQNCLTVGTKRIVHELTRWFCPCLGHADAEGKCGHQS
jgi:hypothetical protein